MTMPQAQHTPDLQSLPAETPALKQRTPRPLIDSYTGEDIGSRQLMSRIKDIMVGPAHFFARIVGGTAEYRMDRTGDFWNLSRVHYKQGAMPLMSLPADEAGTEQGLRLLDLFVQYDIRFYRIIEHFEEDPAELADLIINLYERTLSS